MGNEAHQGNPEGQLSDVCPLGGVTKLDSSGTGDKSKGVKKVQKTIGFGEKFG